LAGDGDAMTVLVDDDDDESHDITTTTTHGRKKRDRGVTMLMPVGCVPRYVIHDSICCPDDDNGKITTTSRRDVISTAMKYVDEYHEQLYGELRIVGGKNCLSFALDLVSHVKSAHFQRQACC
jgi:hypothetical protein